MSATPADRSRRQVGMAQGFALTGGVNEVDLLMQIHAAGGFTLLDPSMGQLHIYWWHREPPPELNWALLAGRLALRELLSRLAEE